MFAPYFWCINFTISLREFGRGLMKGKDDFVYLCITRGM